jgi:hypothetical protein
LKDEARWWDSMRDLNASHIEGLKGHMALAEPKIAEMQPEVAKAAQKADAARGKLEKLKRGEDVSGGLARARRQPKRQAGTAITGDLRGPGESYLGWQRRPRRLIAARLMLRTRAARQRGWT